VSSSVILSKKVEYELGAGVLRVCGAGRAAARDELKLAVVAGGFGAFAIHAGRIIFCVYSCLVTEGYIKFRTAADSFE
jgi:hypothetical protein